MKVLYWELKENVDPVLGFKGKGVDPVVNPRLEITTKSQEKDSTWE